MIVTVASSLCRLLLCIASVSCGTLVLGSRFSHAFVWLWLPYTDDANASLFKKIFDCIYSYVYV